MDENGRGDNRRWTCSRILGSTKADITPNHDSVITTNACEDILLGWPDGQILGNLTNRYGVSSQRASQVITEMRIPGNCEYDENF